MRILAGTDDGLHAFDAGGGVGSVQLPGRRITALGPEYPALWAIVTASEVWRSDGADDWVLRGTVEALRATCIADTRAGVVVGTSEAHLKRVTDAGLEAVEAFDRVEGRDSWYTPWGSPADSRSISEDSNTVYVNVHVGGIVRTKDEGATWEPTIDVDADVHRVWADGSRVFGACARGLAVSRDRGDSWTMRTDGLHATYCRGVARCGETVLVSASTGPGGSRSAVYRGGVEDGSFERCRTGLPEWFNDNVDSPCLDAAPDQGVAAFGTGDGRLFVSTDEGSTWSQVASGLPDIRCVTVMP